MADRRVPRKLWEYEIPLRGGGVTKHRYRCGIPSADFIFKVIGQSLPELMLVFPAQERLLKSWFHFSTLFSNALGPAGET